MPDHRGPHCDCLKLEADNKELKKALAEAARAVDELSAIANIRLPADYYAWMAAARLGETDGV